jgi:1-acyl-sn-glycerol-3-phosphate acyltransferase
MLPRLRKVFWVLFSVFVWSMAFFCMALMVVASLLLLPVLPFSKTHMWIARPAMAMCIWCTFSRIRVIYHPDYDPKRLSIYNGNHVSALDAHMLCRAIPQPICGLSAAESFNIPIYGWIMRLSRSIPVYPRASGRTAEFVAAAKDRIAQGISIAAYAEGGRTLDGKVGQYHRGVFFMARDAGIPIVPIVSRGMFRLLPKGSLLARPSTITVYVGKQVDISHLSDDEVGEFAERFRQLVVDFAEDAKLPDGVTSPWPL